jgi:DNA replication protein DnaC
MISTEQTNLPEFIEIGLKNKLEHLYIKSGIPKKYHFRNINTDWSTEFSLNQKLTGLAKKRSEAVLKFISTYINGLEAIFAGNGLKVTFKNSIEIVSSLFLDGKKASGKTLIASIIAQEAILRGYKVKFVDWVEYLDRFQSFESRQASEDYFFDCLNADLLIFDSVLDYNATNNKFFSIQLDRLIKSRENIGKITICTVDSNTGIPVFGFAWNKFSRETYKLMLPDPELKNETKPKRT